MKEVRVHLELAVPVWHSGLTLKQSADIERVQRVAVSILLGRADFHYGRSCALLGLKPLYVRRQELCERFALKTASPDCRHKDLFQLQNSGHNTRGQFYREHLCHTKRFYKSALPYPFEFLFDGLMCIFYSSHFMVQVLKKRYKSLT